MKVLLVTETLYEGGAELFVLRLARKLNSMGVNADVLSLNKAHENSEATSLFPDVAVTRMSLPALALIEKIDHYFFKLGIDFSIRYFLQAFTIRRKFAEKYDIIHTNFIKVDYLFSRLNRKKHFKHIVTVHGDYSDLYFKAVKKEHTGWLNVKRKINVLLKNVDKWVVISDEQKSFFLDEMHLKENKVEKIYNGFEPLAASPGSGNFPIIDPPVFTVGMVSRGVERKGWQQLIEAFLLLPADFRLVLVGAGEYLDELKKKYAAHTNILFYGFHPNPVEIIREFDVFVLPTLFPYESLPYSIIEALYCAKPVIATRVGEIEKMITDPGSGQQAGFLLDFDNGTISTKQLYDQLVFFYKHPEKLQSFGLTANKAFEKFDMKKCADNYRLLYEEVIRK